MDFHLKIHQDHVYAEVTGSGNAVAQDFTRITQELVTQKDYFTGIGFLHDYRDVYAGHLKIADVQTIAEMVASYRDVLGNSKWAILVNTDLEFGMVRMWEMLVENDVDLSIRIFRDESEARKWIAGS